MTELSPASWAAPSHLAADLEIPRIVEVLVEVPKGSRNEYELDKRTGLVRLDRHLDSSSHDPGDYSDPQFEEVRSLEDVPPHFLREVECFLCTCKSLEQGARVTTDGWAPAAAAWSALEAAADAFRSSVQRGEG